MPWQLTGPRTARWCVNYLAIEGLGCEGQLERLRQIPKPTPLERMKAFMRF